MPVKFDKYRDFLADFDWPDEQKEIFVATIYGLVEDVLDREYKLVSLKDDAGRRAKHN